MREGAGGGGIRLQKATKLPVQEDKSRADAVREWSPEDFLRQLTRIVFYQSIQARKHNARICAICATCTTSSLVAIQRDEILNHPPALRWDDRQSRQEALMQIGRAHV